MRKILLVIACEVILVLGVGGLILGGLLKLSELGSAIAYVLLTSMIGIPAYVYQDELRHLAHHQSASQVLVTTPQTITKESHTVREEVTTRKIYLFYAEAFIAPNLLLYGIQGILDLLTFPSLRIAVTIYFLTFYLLPWYSSIIVGIVMLIHALYTARKIYYSLTP